MYMGYIGYIVMLPRPTLAYMYGISTETSSTIRSSSYNWGVGNPYPYAPWKWNIYLHEWLRLMVNAGKKIHTWSIWAISRVFMGFFHPSETDLLSAIYWGYSYSYNSIYNWRRGPLCMSYILFSHSIFP